MVQVDRENDRPQLVGTAELLAAQRPDLKGMAATSHAQWFDARLKENTCVLLDRLSPSAVPVVVLTGNMLPWLCALSVQFVVPQRGTASTCLILAASHML
jgi:hypothetical protein